MKRLAKHITRIMGLLLLTAFSAGLYAQQPGMADLRLAMNKIKALRTYSYQTENSAVFPNGKADKSTTYVYMDAEHKSLSYRNNNVLLLLTEKWAFKADHRRKQVSVFNVVKYNDQYKKALPELDAVFKNNLAATFMDSIVLKSGKLLTSGRSGSVSTYRLGFPATATVKEMVVVFDEAKQLPVSVTIKCYYPGSGKANGTTTVSVSSHYRSDVQAKDLDPGQYFSLSGKKVQLNQYKNYKVSSIL